MSLGVYVHIPFCAGRCDYCDFATWTDRGHLIDEYVDACVDRRAPPDARAGRAGDERLLRRRDAVADPRRRPRPHPRRDRARRRRRGDRRVQSRLGGSRAARDVRGGRASTGSRSACSRCSPTCSPSSAGPTTPRRSSARSGGRVQPGSSTSTSTSSTGRRASRSTTGAAASTASLALEPDHVSAYALTVEPGTPLGRDIASGGRPRARRRRPGREVRDRRRRPARPPATSGTRSRTGRSPGGECRHNLLYWAQGDYLAIGAAAHGHLAGRRMWNLRTPERYIAAIESGATPEAGEEILDEREPDRGGAAARDPHPRGTPVTAPGRPTVGELDGRRADRARRGPDRPDPAGPPARLGRDGPAPRGSRGQRPRGPVGAARIAVRWAPAGSSR